MHHTNIIFLWIQRSKKDERMDTVIQMASANEILCPVCHCAALLKGLWSYAGAIWYTPISIVWRYERIDHVTSDMWFPTNNNIVPVPITQTGSFSSQNADIHDRVNILILIF